MIIPNWRDDFQIFLRTPTILQLSNRTLLIDIKGLSEILECRFDTSGLVKFSDFIFFSKFRRFAIHYGNPNLSARFFMRYLFIWSAVCQSVSNFVKSLAQQMKHIICKRNFQFSNNLGNFLLVYMFPWGTLNLNKSTSNSLPHPNPVEYPNASVIIVKSETFGNT